MAQGVIDEHQRQHRLGDWRRANADAGVVTAVCFDACGLAGQIHRLAWQPDAVIQRVINTGLRAYTDATITTGPALLEELERTRQHHYAIDDGEHQPGLRCVGAPIRGQNGQVIAGISVSGPSWQINISDVEELSKVVIHHANLIAQRLGYHA